MKNFFRFFIFSLLLTAGQLLHAQTDTVKQVDSVNTVSLSDYKLQLQSLEQQRIADSIKKARLEEQFKEAYTWLEKQN